ncbi:MAG: hypothetical protein JNK49_15840 [Planctomycetes bacterium]|nr:hypothetical protein [Planctomycetota bacterium]
MTGLLGVLVLAAGPLCLGAVAARAIGLRWADGLWHHAAAVWLLGCLGLGALVQLALELHVPPGWWWPLPFAAAALLHASMRLCAVAAADVPGAQAAGRPGRGASSAGWHAFVLLGAGAVVLLAAGALDRPCLEGDEGNIWSLKAKSLLADWPDAFAAAQVHNLHPDYPQLDPLLQAWTYAVLGGIEQSLVANRWLVQGAALGLWLLLCAALRRQLPAWAAAGFAAVLLGEPVFHDLCRTAYADGMVAFGLLAAVHGFVGWRNSGAQPLLRLASGGLAFALWSKNEPLLYVGCLGLATVLLRLGAGPRPSPGPRARLWWWGPSLLVVATTMLWNRRHGLHSDLLGHNPTGKSMFVLLVEQWRERVPVLLGEAWSAVCSPQHGHAGFAALLLVAVVRLRRLVGGALALPTLALLGSWVGLHVVYVGSFLPLRFHLDTSYLRVTFQLLPAALFLLAAQLGAVAPRPAPRDTAVAP